jgi:hypothetical protein
LSDEDTRAPLNVVRVDNQAGHRVCDSASAEGRRTGMAECMYTHVRRHDRQTCNVSDHIIESQSATIGRKSGHLSWNLPTWGAHPVSSTRMRLLPCQLQVLHGSLWCRWTQWRLASLCPSRFLCLLHHLRVLVLLPSVGPSLQPVASCLSPSNQQPWIFDPTDAMAVVSGHWHGEHCWFHTTCRAFHDQIEPATQQSAQHASR